MPVIKESVRTPGPEIPTNPPLMNKKNRLKIREAKFVIGYSKHGDGARAVREAGYEVKSPSSKASELLKRSKIKNAIQPFIDQLDTHRQAVLDELDRRVPFLAELDYEVLLKSVDVITKNSQLLKGASTENIAVMDVSEAYNKLINDVKNG